MNLKFILTSIISVCALHSGAQTLTATYVELADSADRYIRQERWLDAERVIVKALRHEPANKSNYLLWSNLGSVRSNRGDYEGALEALDIGLASAPRSTALLSNRARAYLGLGRVKEAVADLDLALQLDSTLQWPRKMRGISRASSGDFDGADADLQFYTDRFGKDPGVLETMGDIRATRGDADGAVALYKEVYALEPEPGVLTKMLLTAYYDGKLDTLEKELRDGMEKFPREGNLYLMRGLYYKSRFQTSAMEHDFKTARELGVDERLYKKLVPEPEKK